MEGILSNVPLVREIAPRLAPNEFTLVDIGCSGGIDAAWREFGSALRAFCFDPNIEEVKRLQAAERLASIEYIAAFVGVEPNNPDAVRFRAGAFTTRNPWARFSVARSLQLRTAKQMSHKEKSDLNQWEQVSLADRDNPIVLSKFLEERAIEDVDFLKIDVDGADFLILRALKSMLAEKSVLGVCIEVNYFGSADADTHTLHNVDRLMKSVNFELFNLTKRCYSMAALPAPYLYAVPAQGQWGRILQGDAMYFRDLVAPENAQFAATLPATKIAKLAALFAMFGLPDCAAELLLRFRSATYADSRRRRLYCCPRYTSNHWLAENSKLCRIH